MKNIIFLITIIISGLFSQIDYNSQIQPIFDSNCTGCHVYGGAATLNMSSYGGVMSGGVTGPSVVSGDHLSSLLYNRITLPTGTDGSMPPNDPLSQDEIDLIALWIDEGATTLSIGNTNLPQTNTLHQNYPNPFNPITSLRYDLPEDGLVNITIYDMIGRIVKTLVNSSQTAGYKSIQWNATNDRNEPVSAGLYLYTIQAGEFRKTRKMVLLK